MIRMIVSVNCAGTAPKLRVPKRIVIHIVSSS